jgi:hypothetical protein
LELVHTYICGPTRKKSLKGKNYFMVLIDDYSRMTWVMFLKEKYESFEKFKSIKALVETKIDPKIKCLRLDSVKEMKRKMLNESKLSDMF